MSLVITICVCYESTVFTICNIFFCKYKEERKLYYSLIYMNVITVTKLKSKRQKEKKQDTKESIKLKRKISLIKLKRKISKIILREN